MGLDNIFLSKQMTCSLYKSVLVDAKRISDSAASSHYKFLGGNQKRITFIVRSPQAVFVAEKHLSFIIKMLEACKMNIGDIALLNQFSEAVNIQALKQQLQPRMLILFGVESADIQLPFNFPQFKLQVFDGCTYLCVPSLNEFDSELPESKLLKSKLWVCLQKLFDM
jgi:hypothetical protein